MGRCVPRRKRSLWTLHVRPTSAPAGTRRLQQQILDVKSRSCTKCVLSQRILLLKWSGWVTRCILSEQHARHGHHRLSFHCEASKSHHVAFENFDSSKVQEGLLVEKCMHVCSRRPSLPVDNRLSFKVYSRSAELQGAVETLHSKEIDGTLSAHYQPLESARYEPFGSHSSKGGVSSELSRIHSTCQEGHLDKALYLLSSYKRALPISIYVSLLKLCSKKRALNQAKQVHAHLFQNSVPITGLIGDLLVMTLAKCGAVEDAYQISATLPHRTVFSWTAIISAKVDAGYGQEALDLFWVMQKEGIEPSTYTFVSLFKACGITQNLPKGKDLHEFAHRRGFISDPFVSSAVVSFYSKCGSIRSAENVFSSSIQANIITWNAMLAAYVEHEAGVKALKLYRQMQEEGVRPDQLTYVLVLRACGVLAENGEAVSINGESARAVVLHIVRAIHSASQRCAPGPFVDNALVIMYGKCGAILEAEHVFGALSDRNIATWNSMLAAYLQEGESEKVLLMYRQMQQTGITPSERTLQFAVQACGGLAEKEESLIVEGQLVKVSALSIGEGLQMDACRSNIGCSAFVGTSLLGMYGKCGAISKAEAIFVALLYRDTVAWNALLSVYIDQSCGLKALKLFRQMHEEGLIADEVAVMLAFQACGVLLDKERTSVEEIKSTRVWSLEIGKCLHADAGKNGFSLDVNLGSTLISMYAKLGAVSDAENVFLKLPHRDVVLWSTMISAYVEQGQGELALKLCQQMLREGFSMDPHALVYALQACASLAEKDNAVALEIGRVLHAEARSKGYISYPHVGIALIGMYRNCGALDEAKDSFGAWSGVNTVIWNAIFSTYLEHGHYQNVLSLYSQMQEQRLVLDDVSLICILQACSLMGTLQVCNQIHFASASTGWDRALSVAASIIHAYGNCARMKDAQALSDELAGPDLVLWNACCDGFAGIGDFLACFFVVENSELTGTKPDDITFVSALSVCSHTGYVREGFEYFHRMTRDYGIVAGSKHLGNLLDLLSRAGNFRMIENMLSRMSMLVSFPMWLSLLGFCSVHGNIELARQAFEHAVKLQPTDSTAYIVMSNVYNDAGLHGSAAEIERLRQHNGAFES